MNTYTITNNCLSCILIGKIDTINSAVLEQELNEKMNEDITSVVFDMQEVDYISSTFLRIVIKIVKAVGKEHFEIRNIQPSVLKVFKMANLTDVINLG
jgi:anti-anti-sigma factor